MNRMILFVTIFLPVLVFGQKSEIGLTLNAWNYQGDIVTKNSPYLEETQPGLGVFYRYTFHNNFSALGDVSLGRISGDDRNFDQRRDFNPLLDFKTNLITVSGMLEWNILGRERRNIKVYDANGQRISYDELKDDGSVPYYDREGFVIERRLKLKRSVSPYLSLGAGAVFFDPTLNVSSPEGNTVTPKELNQDYSKINVITPMGAGIKVYLTDTWTLHAGVMLMPTYADYIDGASDSRNPSDNDWISRGSLGIAYRPGK
jgi:hypothetical protein